MVYPRSGNEAMIALVDGDITAADGYLDEAGDIAAAIDEPGLGAAVKMHRALARLARGDLAAARRMAGLPDNRTAQAPAGGPAPERDASLLALERCASSACVALASGDRSTALRQAAEMQRRAAANGSALEGRAARRICAAAGEDAAGTADPARYPRLIWVSDAAPGLGSSRRERHPGAVVTAMTGAILLSVMAC